MSSEDAKAAMSLKCAVCSEKWCMKRPNRLDCKRFIEKSFVEASQAFMEKNFSVKE